MTKRSVAPAWQGTTGSGRRQRFRLRFEQLRNLYAVTKYAYRTSIIYAVLVFLNFYARLPADWLLAWFFLSSGIAVARHLAARWFERAQPTERQYRRWAALGSGLVALQAISWAAVLGMAGYTGHPLDLAFAVFLVCALGFGSLPLFGFLVILDSSRNAVQLIRRALVLSFEREELAHRLNEEQELAEVTLRSIGDGVIVADAGGRVISLNPAAERLTGWSRQEASGRPLQQVLQLRDESTDAVPPDLVRLSRSRGGPVVLGQLALHSEGGGKQEAAAEVSVAPIVGAGRSERGVVVVLRDVTELRGMARAVSYQASHDALTGLSNRAAFEGRLQQLLEELRESPRQHALCFLDLDQFKLVNAACGHQAGDALLQQVARLLQRHVRETDCAARLGADEFGILLMDCDLASAQRLAEDICGAFGDFRFHWESHTFKVSASIGLVPLDADSTPAALAAAESSCLIAKEQGRGRVHVASPRDERLAVRHGEARWTQRIQRALDQDAFRLRYQRIVPLHEAGEEMAEVLLGLEEPDGTLVLPGRFLPAAERFNMMPHIDRWVVHTVFERIRAGMPALEAIRRFNINLSGQSLNDEHFLDYVQQQLAVAAIDPRRICFEITETAVIANLERARRFIDALHEAGCAFALDDFGSGLSSFAYLRTLPVDYLKIDGLFVKHMSSDPIDHSMVEAINQVGHIMGIRTIAEFVEDEATLVALRRLGVDYAQGHALHRPEWLP